jgi:citrate/tricarballylate utilization protein
MSVRSIPLALVGEGERIMRICNACRYCEGFCAVFPAMERRTVFRESDLAYLANLCHDCGECFYSCQYAPPHEFDVNVPRVFASIRRETYKKYAWPAMFATLFDRTGIAILLGAFLVPLGFTAILLSIAGRERFFGAHADADGAFYGVMPYALMSGTFSVLGVLILLPFFVGAVRFWRETEAPDRRSQNTAVWLRGLRDAATLRYLDGGGEGCAYPSEVPSPARRWFHHFTFYGFMLCFAATTVAAFYHHAFGWHAPYPFLSLPVVLGSVGGVGLLVGPAGLAWLKLLRDAQPGERTQVRMDVVFLVLLFLTSLTGFLLLLLRESTAMGTILGLHLGLVAGLFLTMPYGKFVHAIYRVLALVRYAGERHA